MSFLKIPYIYRLYKATKKLNFYIMKRILSLMAVLISTFIFAQTNVSGIVVDEDNNPIPGANIVFDSTTGAVANFDGEFSITVKQNPPFSLTVSSVGFETETVEIGSGNLSISVTLNESENLLDDVVMLNQQELISMQVLKILRVFKLIVEDYYFKLLVPEVFLLSTMKVLFN